MGGGAITHYTPGGGCGCGWKWEWGVGVGVGVGLLKGQCVRDQGLSIISSITIYSPNYRNNWGSGIYCHTSHYNTPLFCEEAKRRGL